ncbi:uncharacterized protein LOC132931698 [Rhopalosiphum padi]|uniref:uncharacterized protein LOC132931698 n=1 Tax=Rhopalosiphum padi TaxID=40932 RepID=UPI00298E1348|nr:uncharacterized protein LOC132931698 [Rhopalosiphum padi]
MYCGTHIITIIIAQCSIISCVKPRFSVKTMQPTIRVLLSIATILGCLKLTFSLQLNIPKPDTVLISVPFDQLKNINWMAGNPDYTESTCGTFKAYETDTIEKVVGRWYTVYISNIPSTTDYCSQFSNIQSPCRCSGIDFTIDMKDNVISFVLFSTNIQEKSVTYELATASFVKKTQLKMDKIILRSFVMKTHGKTNGLAGFIVPQGVIVDSDDFKSYIVMVFCKERAKKPIVMVLVNALPISEKVMDIALKFLNDNNFDTRLLNVQHSNCKYGQNIVGY